MENPTSKKVRFGVVGAWNQDEHLAIMAGTSLNYFTCTLGEAARWNAEHPHPFYTVNDLIDEQAKEFRQRSALNVAGEHAEDGKEIKSDFTYRELRDFSLAAATRLRRRLQGTSHVGSGTVGLHCSNSVEFILTWLGLMRLGVTVMLLTPGLGSAAIKHLCLACNISTIFIDARNYEKVRDLKDSIIFISTSNVLVSLKPDPVPASFPFNPKVDDVAYIFHSCGTSYLPEPIPQSHLSAASVLPHLPHADSHATFSATPLYHGGIIDCLRAWSSGATIHLFPGTQPVTAANVHAAVDRANAYLDGTYPVKYFTCEPDLLQSLSRETSASGEKKGLRLLQQMELVGIAGPGLSPMIGGQLIANDVKLVLRYITPECGFMLSSHRDYGADREWSYLRADPMLQPDYYDFEPQPQQSGREGGEPLFEFVIKSKWPIRRATNRPDGSFATGDLFVQHPSMPHAWQYHGRVGERITLLGGGTFDPVPIEEALLGSDVGRRMLVDAMVFGMGREAPGVLLSPMWAESFVSNEHVIEEVWPTIHRMNKISQNQARIPRDGLVVARMQVQTGKQLRLPRDNKGLLLRGQTERIFAKDIRAACAGATDVDKNRDALPDADVMDELARVFDETMGRHIDTRNDLSAQGVDSTACSQLRSTISKTFFPDLEISLPPNIIQAQGSIENLSKYILQCRTLGAETLKVQPANHGGISPAASPLARVA